MERLNHSLETDRQTPRAITPQEIIELQKEQTPPEVIDTMNRLLSEYIRQGHARIRQDTVIGAMVDAGLDRMDVLTQPWLDFEDDYRAAGWNVSYKSPKGEQEFEPYYEFRAKRPRELGNVAMSETVGYDPKL